MTEPAEGQITTPPNPKAQVIAWLLDGHRDEDIREAIAAKFPGTNADELLTAVVTHFVDAARCDKTVVLGWCIEAYRDLYRRLVAIGDFAGALKAVKELAGLAGRTRGVRTAANETGRAGPDGKRPGRAGRRRVDRTKPVSDG